MGIFGRFLKPDIKKMEGKGDVEGLIKALRHEDSDVRRKAEEALGRIGGPTAVELLFDVFRDKEEDDGVRRAALRSLKRTGSSEVVELFIRVLKYRSQDVDVRAGVAEALGELGGPRATEVLIDVFKDKNEDVSVRYQAGCSFRIGRIASPRAAVNPKVVESLVEVITDKNEDIRLRVGFTEVLESMSRGPGSVELVSTSARALIKVADDKDEDQRLRDQAEWALGRIKGWLEEHPRARNSGLTYLFKPEARSEVRARWGKVEELLTEIRDFFGKRYPIAMLSFKRPKKCLKCGGEEFTFSIDHKCFRCKQCGILIERGARAGGVLITDHRTDEERQMEREARAGVSLGPEVDAMVNELIDIGRNVGFFGKDNKFDEDNRNKRAREIGMMLNEMGGFELMQKVWYRVYLTLRAEGGARCGSLERAWGYIGDWLP